MASKNIQQTNINYSTKEYVLLGTAIILVRNQCGTLIPCRAILDSASQLNFITSSLANQLQLRKKKSATIISGIGASGLVSDS